MILSEKVITQVSNRNYEHYKSKGYFCGLNSKLEVLCIDLHISSSSIVLVKCDYCGYERDLMYSKYIFNTSNNTKPYACKKCHFQKAKITCLEKYGVDNVWKSEKVKDKIKKTNLEKYGTEHAISSKEIQEKRIISFKENIERWKESYKQTSIEKYGVDNPSKSNIIKDKAFENHKNAVIERYKDIDVKDLYRDGDLEFLCKGCEQYKIMDIHLFHQRYKVEKNRLCLDCFPRNGFNGSSIPETTIKDYIEELGFKTEKDRLILKGKEIDILVRDKNLAIEYNSFYCHSEDTTPVGYHISKTNLCNQNGIKLIHIWEDYFYNKFDIVKSRLLNELGLTPNRVFARKCVIKEVIPKVSQKFLNDNHLQGSVDAKYKIGLFYNEELVSLMTFGSLRRNTNHKTKLGHFEMYRFCNKLNTNVIGAAGKLFKYFVDKYKPEYILSFADRDWTNVPEGSVYDKLGFKYKGESGPGYHWIVNDKRENRWKYQKHILLAQGFEGKTEDEIMHKRGYKRAFNTGNLNFEWNRVC